MNGQALNNGYVLKLHFYDGGTRYFGPYPTTTLAVAAFIGNVKGVKLHIDDKARSRPVIDRRYRVEYSKSLIVAISVATLENTLHLFNLSNPKG